MPVQRLNRDPESLAILLGFDLERKGHIGG
jgi:hypothetical protein